MKYYALDMGDTNLSDSMFVCDLTEIEINAIINEMRENDIDYQGEPDKLYEVFDQKGIKYEKVIPEILDYY